MSDKFLIQLTFQFLIVEPRGGEPYACGPDLALIIEGFRICLRKVAFLFTSIQGCHVNLMTLDVPKTFSTAWESYGTLNYTDVVWYRWLHPVVGGVGFSKLFFCFIAPPEIFISGTTLAGASTRRPLASWCTPWPTWGPSLRTSGPRSRLGWPRISCRRRRRSRSSRWSRPTTTASPSNCR